MTSYLHGGAPDSGEIPIDLVDEAGLEVWLEG